MKAPDSSPRGRRLHRRHPKSQNSKCHKPLKRQKSERHSTLHHPNERHSPIGGLGATVGDKISGPWGPLVSKRAGEKLLATRTHRSAGERRKHLPWKHPPRANPVAPSPGSGVAKPDRGTGWTKGKSLEWIARPVQDRPAISDRPC